MVNRSALDEVRIASPCSASWDAMTGDDRKRFCAMCGKDVFNLSALTTAEGLALLAGPGPLPCLQLHRRADGTTITADCPVGVRAARRRRGRLVAGFGVGLTLVAAAFGFRREANPLVGHDPAVSPDGGEVIGGEPAALPLSTPASLPGPSVPPAVPAKPEPLFGKPSQP